MLEDIINRFRQARTPEFDPYDSSHPQYSENYNKNDGMQYKTKISNFGCRFRERLELRLNNPEEPESYQKAMAKTSAEFMQFYQNGKFNISDYVKSECFRERQALTEDKLKRKIARDINLSIDKQLANEIKKVNITDYALEKAKYAAKSVSRQSRQAGLGASYELAMYMLSSSLDENDNTVTDIYIAPEQIVKNNHCDITPDGVRKAIGYSRTFGKRIIGWSHSHGKFSSFFSEEDDNTLLGENRDGGRSFRPFYLTKKVSTRQFSSDIIRYFNALVVNESNDEPSYRIIAIKPRYYVEDGEIKKKNEIIDFERTPAENKDYRNSWPIPQRIRTGEKINEQQIDADIIERVRFDNNRRLSDYYSADSPKNIKQTLPEKIMKLLN